MTVNPVLLALPRGAIIAIVILVILIGVFVALYFLGKRMQKRQEEQEEQLQAYKQTVSMLVIDKKRLKVTESGLPQMVIDQTPKMLRWQKLPIVKAKVGPQVLSMVCDEKIFDDVPVKKEVKATVSGIYIIGVKGLHGKQAPKEEKKKSFFKRAVENLQEKAGAKPIDTKKK